MYVCNIYYIIYIYTVKTQQFQKKTILFSRIDYTTITIIIIVITIIIIYREKTIK